MSSVLLLGTAVDPSAQLPSKQAGSALDPLDYYSLGEFPTVPGSYVFNTSGVPTLIGPGVRIEGIVVDHVAVFAFDDIHVRADMNLDCLGTRPLAILSHRNATVEGRIRAGTCGISGAGAGENSPSPFAGGGGGGFGGAGLDGLWSLYDGYGGRGGSPYGDLLVALQGGSAGGAGAAVETTGGGSGGGSWGGGALEVGAVDTVAIRGPGVYADGEHGWQPEICIADPTYDFGGAGGGSGGGILVHAEAVVLETRLSARGGNGGGSCGAGGPGGGGGGGRIAVIVGSGGFLNTGTIVVAGGTPWALPTQLGKIDIVGSQTAPAVNFTVEAHTFAAGGQGCWQGPFFCGGAYYDETPGNWGDAQVRPGTDVDLWYDDGGIVIGGLDGLEWVTFPVTVPQSGTYTVTFRTASPADRPSGSGVVNVGVYGVGGSWIGNQTVPVTGGAGDWHTYVTWQAPTTIYLPAGAQTLTMWAAGGWYNVRSMRFTFTQPR